MTVGRWHVVLRGDTVEVWDTASPYYDPSDRPTVTARWSPILGCHDAFGASLTEATWARIDRALGLNP